MVSGLSKLNYPFLSEQEFGKYEGNAFLWDSNRDKASYANRMLGCNLTKGIDLLAKAGDIYIIIGEAIFLTGTDGHQYSQFRDADTTEGDRGSSNRDRTKMHRQICEVEETALSALLLKDSLESLR